MSRLTARAQSAITIHGNSVSLNTSYRNALQTWDALDAAADGILSPLAAAHLAISYMLGMDITDMTREEIDEALKGIAGYLNKYARSHDAANSDNSRPLLDLEQDAIMLFDAFMSMGVDLDAEDISYPRFMSLLRELPKEAAICRVVYLRQQHRAGKLTKEERSEIYRRGWDVIKLRNRKADRQATDNADHFKALQNKMRIERGLDPL